MKSDSFLEVKPRPLPFNPRKLNGISEKMIVSHWENNYKASIKTLNTLRKTLKGIPEDEAFHYGAIKREHLYRNGSIVYHDMYFGNLGGNGKPDKVVKDLLKKDFGDFDSWKEEFKKIGKSLSGGSGWVFLGYNLHLGILENFWNWDHKHAPLSTLPILVMDMYEHAYQMDYGAAADKYIEAFFKNINWEEVHSRIEKSKKVKWV